MVQVVLQIAAEAARAILHSFPDYAIMTVGEEPVNAVDGGVSVKVLIATDCYRFNLGGIATSVLALSAGLRGLGHEVKVLALSNSHRSFRDGDDAFIRSFPAPYYPDMRISFAMRDPLLRELEVWGPDIIHIQTEGSARRLGLRLHRLGHAPVVMTCHTDYSHFIFHGLKTTAPVKALMRAAGKHLYRHADRVTTPSRKAAAFPFLDSVRERLTVVPNGMEIEKYQRHFTQEARRAFRASLGIGDEAGVLVTVSRLSKEKNIQELISYLPGLLRKAPNTRLLIVGDGPYRQKLVKLAEKLSLSDRVIFAGRVPAEDVWQYYDAGDLFVSASTFEVQGMTYVEAMACGLPLVCRDDACLVGVVEQHKSGMTYRTGTEFADYSAQLLSDEKLRAEMGDRAARKAADFSCDAFAGAMLKVYAGAIAARKAGKTR